VQTEERGATMVSDSGGVGTSNLRERETQRVRGVAAIEGRK
jgi:hypothetical protein